MDLILNHPLSNTSAVLKKLHSLNPTKCISLKEPFIIVSQHPVVTEYMSSLQNFRCTFQSVADIGLPVVWILPNDDAGSSMISIVRKEFHHLAESLPILFAHGFVIEEYASLLSNCRCLLGNSSSGIREACSLGVPVVNIGTRQTSRLRGHNVIDVGYDSLQITAAVKKQIKHGFYEPQFLYGNGNSGVLIADILASVNISLDKTISY